MKIIRIALAALLTALVIALYWSGHWALGVIGTLLAVWVGLDAAGAWDYPKPDPGPDE